MNYKILLNCFPPTNIFMPSIGCEILNAYITKNNNIDSEQVYWNFLFQEKMPEGGENFFEIKNDLDQVLPFLAILYGNENPKLIDRIAFRMQVVNPSFKTLGANYYREKLSKQINHINEIIKNELDRLLDSENIIFGISAKFDSWIPGIVVAQEVKKRKPDTVIVLGGIEEENAAKVLFEEFQVFDFAIWGEGEIPLSKLINKLIEKDNNYEGIPRLLSRNEKQTELKNTFLNKYDRTSGFINMREYPDINYDVYFKNAEQIEKKHLAIPIEISRGCRWNKCDFCALNWGYSYRTQDLDSVVRQIKKYYERYKIPRFFFVDNDVVGKKIDVFEQLLDKLIQLSTDLEVDFDFHADILHLKFNNKLIKKLSLAGFRGVQIGYEAVSDPMLKKLNKSTTFAENILFVKFAQKYDVEVTITGLIVGIPGETEEDVFESVNNLHFLRFFLGQKKNELRHPFNELMLFYETGYWNMLSQKEREEFNKHPLNEFLPEDFVNNIHVKYSVLGQYKRPALMDKWDFVKSVSDFYEKSDFRYYLIENNGVINYIEYKDNLKIESLTFDQPEYWDVLMIANDEVISLTKLHRELNKKYPEINKEKLITIVEELKNSYLLYSSKDYRKIISIIDTDRL